MSLDPYTLAALREHRRRQLEERLAAGSAWQDTQTDHYGTTRTGLVFVWPDGTLINPERFTRWLTTHVEGAGLPRIRLHDVRHSYASAGLANAAGWAEVKVISERLGHASIGITLDTYSHVLPDRDAEVAATLATAILGENEIFVSIRVHASAEAGCLLAACWRLRRSEGCERGDSNPHSLVGHWDLNPARLPVPPRSRGSRTYR